MEKKKKITVTLGIRPNSEELTEISQNGGTRFDLLGLNVKTFENNAENAWSNIADSEGVIVVEVKPDSIAEENNIQWGDIIIEIGQTAIKDLSAYESELKSYTHGDTILLRVLRGNNPIYIAFDIEKN